MISPWPRRRRRPHHHRRCRCRCPRGLPAARVWARGIPSRRRRRRRKKRNSSSPIRSLEASPPGWRSRWKIHWSLHDGSLVAVLDLSFHPPSPIEHQGSCSFSHLIKGQRATAKKWIINLATFSPNFISRRPEVGRIGFEDLTNPQIHQFFGFGFELSLVDFWILSFGLDFQIQSTEQDFDPLKNYSFWWKKWGI